LRSSISFIGRICLRWDDENLKDDVEISVSIDKFKNALKLLPDNYYSLLYVTLVCGNSITEAASLFGLTRENAKKIYERAKRKIKEITESEVFI
jgi:DNA-directed RNA polymerase specialized sigma24 family protein